MRNAPKKQLLSNVPIALIINTMRMDGDSYCAKRQFDNFKLLKRDIDVQPLLKELEDNAYLWDEIRTRQNTEQSPHKYTAAVFLRWCEELSVHAAFNELSSRDYPALRKLPSAQPLIESVLDAAGSSELGRVLVVALFPGAFITKHSDEGAYADRFERFHLSLQSEDGNFFYSERAENSGEFVHMLPGELWNFNHKEPHYLINNSKTPRMHLIVDCVSKNYRKERLTD